MKLITKQKTLAFVEDTARLLEYESGGILVAIERIPKGYALIYYRGKNYRRPISLRPRNLLTKAKALKRSVAMQRHEVSSCLSFFFGPHPSSPCMGEFKYNFSFIYLFRFLIYFNCIM